MPSIFSRIPQSVALHQQWCQNMLRQELYGEIVKRHKRLFLTDGGMCMGKVLYREPDEDMIFNIFYGYLF